MAFEFSPFRAATASAIAALCLLSGCSEESASVKEVRFESDPPPTLSVDLEGLVSVHADGLYVFAPTRDVAQEMFFSLHGAAMQFERTFGATPRPAVLIVDSPDLAMDEAKLLEAGCPVVFGIDDWTSAFEARGDGTLRKRVQDLMVDMYLEFPTMKAYVDECNGSQGCVDEVRLLLAEAASEHTAAYLKQISATMHPDQLVPHEIGHLLFMERYWPGSWYDDDYRYGGPARDWLDEAAAVLLEPPLLTTSRRANARAMFDGKTLPAAFVPLNEFFTMTHPSFDPDASDEDDLNEEDSQGFEFTLDYVTIEMEREGETVSRRVRLGGDGALLDAPDVEQHATDGTPTMYSFYTQCRSLIDFVESRAVPERVWRSIAEHAAAGGEMDGWLTTHGESHGLPDTVAELEAAWIAWGSRNRR